MKNNKIPQETEEEITEELLEDIKNVMGSMRNKGINYKTINFNKVGSFRYFIRKALVKSFKAGQKQSLDFTDGFREGRLYEQNKFKEMIEEMEDTHCCFTDWRNNGKRIWVKELLSKIGDGSKEKQGEVKG